eukprot:TRINITY_DN4535_c0_g1_i3.p1 TRINITY_DN4535_c0_g1~~TRINITY_DN4535_c0_g1_i3.p1  ORF type:complete len:310 (+),score=89.80 TRINITY_DN4535_c0_g1_i3:101-1030(+)
MLRSLVGSEMCIRDRYQRRVRGTSIAAMQQDNSCPELRAQLQKLKAGTTPEAFQVAIKTLLTFARNVEAHPQDEKYRKIMVSNSAFQKRVTNHPGGLECVKAIGFVQNAEGDALVLTPNAEAWEVLVASTKELQAHQQSANSTAPLTQPTGGTQDLMASMQQMMGANPSLGNAMSNPEAMSGMAPMLQQIAQNPQLLQQAMSNPMLQQMASSNPMMAQIIQNPAMLQSMLSSPIAQQLLSDPSAMQAAMANPAGFMGNTPPAPAAAAPAPAPAAAPHAPAGMSEDEMLAQAIRESLENTPTLQDPPNNP